MLPIQQSAQAGPGSAPSGLYRACSILLMLAISLVLSPVLSGCQTESPEAETVLWLKLNDSLSRYESVLVQIVDRNDTDKVLATLWNKPLPAPRTDIQPFRLKTLADEDFIVEIMGYQAQQLALQPDITSAILRPDIILQFISN